MKKIIFVFLCLLSAQSFSQNRDSYPSFDKSKDFLLIQHDCKTDTDDIQSIALEGGMLLHPDFSGVRYFAVFGSYGYQTGKPYIDRAPEMGPLAYGVEGLDWLDADAGYQAANKTFADADLDKIADIVEGVIEDDGIVWVEEAGPSNFTEQWLRKLIDDRGVSSATLKDHVIVVQHSSVNEGATEALAYVKRNATYQKIDDGNSGNKPDSDDTPD